MGKKKLPHEKEINSMRKNISHYKPTFSHLNLIVSSTSKHYFCFMCFTYNIIKPKIMKLNRIQHESQEK